MRYNTEEKRLALPEYGRNIQNMVDYCVTIQDREERKRCANAIINIMGNMFPHLRDVNDFKHILWDHLAIMADFKLDIDYPYEIVRKENLYNRPPRIPYNNNRIRYRHYGKTLELMINKATRLEPGPERSQLIRLLANQMKKSFLTWNKESVDDRNFGCTPDECREWIELLRWRLDCCSRIGFNFDLGHARNNGPLANLFTISDWYEELGDEINGFHLHQVVKRPDGTLCNHMPLVEPFGSLISLASLFLGWRRGTVNPAPMFLEIRDGDPVESMCRLRAALQP